MTMKTRSSLYPAAILAATLLTSASFGAAIAQTAPAAAPSSDPVHVIQGPIPAVATPTPKQKAAMLRAKNKQTVKNQDTLKQGYIPQTKLSSSNAAPSASGSNCIQSQTPQNTQQMQANTGQPTQTLVDVPVDGSASVASASSRDRLAQACTQNRVSP
jgi:hypothetical protein